MTLAPGCYLLAGPAAYKVLAVGADAITVRVEAGSKRFHRRRITWERSNIEANVALGIITVATEYAAPETAAPSLLDEEGQGDGSE